MKSLIKRNISLYKTVAVLLLVSVYQFVVGQSASGHPIVREMGRLKETASLHWLDRQSTLQGTTSGRVFPAVVLDHGDGRKAYRKWVEYCSLV